MHPECFFATLQVTVYENIYQAVRNYLANVDQTSVSWLLYVISMLHYALSWLAPEQVGTWVLSCRLLFQMIWHLWWDNTPLLSKTEGAIVIVSTMVFLRFLGLYLQTFELLLCWNEWKLIKPIISIILTTFEKFISFEIV